MLKFHPLIFIFLLLIGALCHALPEDRKQVAQLAANTADLNQQTHQGEYLGNVAFDQGTTHLRAEKAITRNDKDNKLSFAVAYGNKERPAHYWEQTAINKPMLHAYALEIRYHPQKHVIELIGNARVVQGDDSFTAPKIIYNTEKQHVLAVGNEQARTIIVMHPGTPHE